MNNEKSVSVVIPAYNEAENIPELVSALHKLENQYPLYDFEFVFIDDGSSDSTAELIKEHAIALKNYKLIVHFFNKGLTSAIVDGVKAASHKYIFFLPADMQYSPDIIPGFLDKALEGYDIVAGKKIGKYEKRTVSYIYNSFCRFLFKVKVSDINSVKIFNRAIIENINLHKDWHRYIIPLASLGDKKICELPVQLFPRKFGTSKFKGKLRILIGLLDLISVRILWSFKRKPMLILGSMGLLSFTIGFLSGLYFAYSRLIHKLPYEPSITFVTLFLISGLLFFVAGFLAEIIIEALGDK